MYFSNAIPMLYINLSLFADISEEIVGQGISVPRETQMKHL